MATAFLVGGVRTPFGRYGGALAGVRPDDLAALVVRAAVERTGIDPGRFEADLLSVETPAGPVTVDEGPRPDTSMERLGRLKPSFAADGIVTAGSSSPLSDGAAAMGGCQRASGRRVQPHTACRAVTAASAGVAPSVMGLGPVPATRKALDRVGWTTGDLDAAEINEAFAPQVLACVRRLGLDPELVNTDGGAIALGHPLGCSGARLVITLLGRLERQDGRRGLASLCVGVGQGASMLIARD